MIEQILVKMHDCAMTFIRFNYVFIIWKILWK